MAGAISSYPGAAGPVSGTVAPSVMLLEVTPGADAAGGLDLGDELQADSSVAPRAIPSTPVARTLVYLPIDVGLLCLIASPFLIAL